MPTLPINAEIQTSAEADRLEMPAGSTAPAFRVRLTEAGDRPLDLAGSVRVDFRLRLGREVVVDQRMRAVDPGDGVVEYEWRPGDTDEAGVYRARLYVRYSDGTVLVCPSREPLVVHLVG